jgi:hypothetical protein
VGPDTNAEVNNSLCIQLPIDIQLVGAVEDLFPLLSNPSYYTDFVCINAGLFHCRPDGLDMFDIVNTLSTGTEIISDSVVFKVPLYIFIVS